MVTILLCKYIIIHYMPVGKNLRRFDIFDISPLPVQIARS